MGRQHRSKLQDLIEESHPDRQNIHQLFRLGKFYQMSIVDNKSLSKLGDQEGIFHIFQWSNYKKVNQLGILHMFVYLDCRKVAQRYSQQMIELNLLKLLLLLS